MKTHLNFAASDLEKSVAYYRTLLGSDPVKHFDDYALFVTEDPGIELALDSDPGFQAAHGAHFGIVADSADGVDAAVARLDASGFKTLVEREETCCYAKQSKVWSSDPDGRRWEVYTVHEETEERDNERTTCCS